MGIPRRGFRRRTARDATPGRIAALLACALLACATPLRDAAPPAPPTPPPPAGAVRVQLVFGAEADLDLYVTGPANETVYFANERSADGGRLEADLRCDAPAPRVETVVFPQAPAGDYRVGVDFPERCDGGADEAVYRLVVRAPGGVREAVGRVSFARFASRALRFRVPGSDRKRAANREPGAPPAPP